MGTRTPHWKSTSLESAASAATARERGRRTSSTAERRACAGTGASLFGVEGLLRIVEQGPPPPGPSGRGGFRSSTEWKGDFPQRVSRKPPPPPGDESPG